MSISPLTKKAELRLHSSFLAVSGAIKKCLEIGLHSNPLRELTPVNPNLACLVWYVFAKDVTWLFHCKLYIFTRWRKIASSSVATRESLNNTGNNMKLILVTS